MRLKAVPFEIPREDPFKNDLLSRKTCAEQLTELLKSSDEPLVLCINAAWGDGKTTFIKMWRVYLNQEGFKTLYFNAWENDQSDDALVSLIGELAAGMDELKITNGKAEKVKVYLEKAKKIGAGLIKKGIPLAVRVGTGGLVDITELQLDEQTVSKLSELGEEVAKKQIEKYEESKKTLSNFREQLRSFAEVATAPEEGKERRPIVILVDELDRCRPPYAVQVLEKIKHLFNVRNIDFVIAADKDQLGHSVRSMYGQGMDANGYLRRFIDLDFSLPAPEAGAFCRAQFARFGLAEVFARRTGDLIRYDQKQFTDTFVVFFTGFGLSLREQEHCFSLLSLALRTTPDNVKIYPFLLSTLIVLKIKNHQLYADFILGRVSSQAIINYIRSTSTGREFLEDNYGVTLEIELTLCQKGSGRVDDLIAKNKGIAADTSSPASEQQRASEILQMLQQFWRNLRDVEGCLVYLVQKIDLVSHFEK